MLTIMPSTATNTARSSTGATSLVGSDHVEELMQAAMGVQEIANHPNRTKLLAYLFGLENQILAGAQIVGKTPQELSTALALSEEDDCRAARRLKNSVAKELGKHIFKTSKGDEWVIGISNRLYRLVFTRPAIGHTDNRALVTFWRPFLTSGHAKDQPQAESAHIHVLERLFFRHGLHVYVRDTRINHVDDKRRLANSGLLVNEKIKDLKASVHYVSSGELNGALQLVLLFQGLGQRIDFLNVSAIDPQRVNLISIGGKSAEGADFDPPDYEEFCVTRAGVTRKAAHGKLAHSELFRDESHADVLVRHVLFSRRKSRFGDKVVVVLQSDHGRAIEGVCKELANESRVDALLSLLGNGRVLTLPIPMQIVFKVRLKRHVAISVATEVQCVCGRLYEDLA